MFKQTWKQKDTKGAQTKPTSGKGQAPTDGPDQAEEISVGPTTPPNPSALFQKGVESMQKTMIQHDTENQAGAASGSVTASISANPPQKGQNSTFAEMQDGGQAQTANNEPKSDQANSAATLDHSMLQSPASSFQKGPENMNMTMGKEDAKNQVITAATVATIASPATPAGKN